MKVKAYKVNTFAKSGAGGNTAGVVLDADSLAADEMQRIAGSLGFSETAFIGRSSGADFKVRFFTPNEEVDLCGHATIGSFFALASLGRIRPGRYSQETKAGVLAVEVREDLAIMMNQPVPRFHEVLDRTEIAASLNIQADALREDLPVQIVSTGLRDILAPVKTMGILNAIAPDFAKIASISRKFNATGYHLFALESLHGSHAHCRNFAPLCAIPEESATGTSSGALGCYLFRYDRLDREQAGNIVFEQGYAMNKPSEIVVSLTVEAKEILAVKVGGRAYGLAEIEAGG